MNDIQAHLSKHYSFWLPQPEFFVPGEIVCMKENPEKHIITDVKVEAHIIDCSLVGFETNYYIEYIYNPEEKHIVPTYVNIHTPAINKWSVLTPVVDDHLTYPKLRIEKWFNATTKGDIYTVVKTKYNLREEYIVENFMLIDKDINPISKDVNLEFLGMESREYLYANYKLSTGLLREANGFKRVDVLSSGLYMYPQYMENNPF